MLENFVRNMIESGRFQDLLDLLREESTHTTDNCNNVPKSKEEVELYVFSIKHIEVLRKNKIFFHQPIMKGEDNSLFSNHFELWLKGGAKGLEESEVTSYLLSKPF
jgi:hypothetical protein